MPDVKLWLCRVELEFVVAAPTEGDALDIAMDATQEEIDFGTPRVLREITGSGIPWLENRVPYGESSRTVAEILAERAAAGQ